MADIYYDDENYNDGFDDDSYTQGMKLELWRRLLAYALNYRLEISALSISAVMTAQLKLRFP